MVHIIKVFLEEPNKEKQIRRIAVNSDIVGKYDLLLWKIRELFLLLENKQFDITWKDSENDTIHMSSDDELAQALANAEDGLLKIYIFVSNDSEKKTPEVPKPKTNHNDMHPFVSCDGCDEGITGYRYKCLQCKDFDLCSNCNAADKHPNHDMIKLTKPAHVPREWVFLGARKMWKSMFSHSPSTFYHHQRHQQERQQKPESPPQATSNPCVQSQWQKVVDDLLKGDFVPAEKLLKDNLGCFLNFVESVAGGVDVKIENPPFGAAAKKPETGAAANNASEELPFPSGQCAGVSSEKKDLIVEKEVNKTEQEVKPTTEKEEVSVCATNNDAIENERLVSFDTPLSNTNDAKENNVSVPSAPNGLFSYIDTSVNADGWTLLGAHSEKQDGCAATEFTETGAKPKTTAIYPEIPEAVKSCQTPTTKTPETMRNIQTSTEDMIFSNPTGETMPKEPLKIPEVYPPVAVTQDPTILNALMKMQAMGFSNEGGWLERLLLAKNGNINEALDSLYPNTRRQ